jgi:Acetokinase family
MDTTASSVMTALIEAGNFDTVYRDVYLDRARTFLAPCYRSKSSAGSSRSVLRSQSCPSASHARSTRPTGEDMNLLDLAGKRGLVVGIANAHRIAYGWAKAFHAAGAELAITYLNAKAVFTAGIGVHAAPVRARVCEGAAWLGIRFDAVANLAGGPRISTADSPVSVWVVPTNEELMIARHTLARTRL